MHVAGACDVLAVVGAVHVQPLEHPADALGGGVPALLLAPFILRERTPMFALAHAPPTV